MAETEPVRVVVEIVDNFSDELRELRRKLAQLDATDIDIDADVDDSGDVESMRAKLEALQDNLEVDVDFDPDGFAQTMAMKRMLARDTTSEVTFRPDHDAADDFLQTIDRATTEWARDEGPLGGTGLSMPFDGRDVDMDMFSGANRLDSPFDRADIEADLSQAVTNTRALQDEVRPDIPSVTPRGFGLGMPDLDMRDAPNAPDGSPQWINDFTKDAEGLNKAFSRLRPTMTTWWNIIAAALPAVIALSAAVFGLAAALLTVGGAAAAIVGVGLLGWGDSMQSSLRNLQEEARMLAQELFGVMQPAAGQFQPIMSDAMDALPNLVERLVDPLQRATGFADDLAQMGTGVVDWMAMLITAAANLERQTTQLISRFGEITGTTLLRFFRAVVQDTYRNQQAYIALADALGTALLAIFEISQAASFAFVRFRPLLDVVLLLARALNSDLGQSLIMIVGGLFLLEKASAAALAVMGALRIGVGATAASILGSLLPSLTTGIAMMWQWVTAANAAWAATARFLALTGVGLALVLGSGALVDQLSGQGRNQRGPRTPGSGATRRGGTSITINGNVGRREMDRMLDRMPQEARTTFQRQRGMEKP
jgi:hypothetical protein